MTSIAALAASAVLVVGCADGSGLQVTDARVGQPTGPNAALYFTVSGNGGEADRLVSAHTEAAEAVGLHETTMGDDGSMRMRPVGALDLPADGTLILEPGGYHMMLINAARLEVGDTVDVTLVWETAGDMAIVAEVVEPGDTTGEAP